MNGYEVISRLKEKEIKEFECMSGFKIYWDGEKLYHKVKTRYDKFMKENVVIDNAFLGRVWKENKLPKEFIDAYTDCLYNHNRYKGINETESDYEDQIIQYNHSTKKVEVHVTIDSYAALNIKWIQED